MSNITNTCLYQACTKITNIPSQDMCLNHVPKHVPNHQPVPYQASTMYHNLYHNKCINHAPTPVPNHASIKHAPQPCINHINHASTMYINTMYHVSIINHVHQHHTIHHIIPYTNKPTMYQQCISTSRPQPTCTMHPMMCLKSYTKPSQTHASSMLLNITKITS
jgi:hypothetical protein